MAAVAAVLVLAAAVVVGVVALGDDEPDLRAGPGRGDGPHGHWVSIFSAEEVRLQPSRYGDAVGFSTSLVSDDKDVKLRAVSLTTPCLVLRSAAAPAATGDLLDALFITLRGVYRAGRDDGRPVTRRDCLGGKGSWPGYVDADVDVGGEHRRVRVALQGPIYLAPPAR